VPVNLLYKTFFEDRFLLAVQRYIIPQKKGYEPVQLIIKEPGTAPGHQQQKKYYESYSFHLENNSDYKIYFKHEY
jgi:hypothetical protein